jgi:pimeloyl-ACP methyl ester carboxylesterase
MPAVTTEGTPLLQPFLAPDEWYPAADASVSARLLDVDGGERVRLLEAGAVGGEPVVLIHGWGASAYNFRRLLPLLAEARLRGLAFDLRGHGLSSKPADPSRYTAAAMAQQVFDLLDALGLKQAVLVGQSMGGAIALDAAGLAPDRVRGVVLLSPIGLLAIRRITVARAVRASQWLGGRVPRWGISMLLRRVYGSRAQYETRDIDEYWAPAQFPEFVPSLFHLVNRFDWKPRSAEAFRRPGSVRLVLGELDRLVTTPRALARVRRIGALHATVVPGAGHLVAEEAPEYTVQAIREALIDTGDRAEADAAPRATSDAGHGMRPARRDDSSLRPQ